MVGAANAITSAARAFDCRTYACERAIGPSLSHVGEIVGARPGNATAVVFRACTSCRSVFLSVHNISVAYASSVRIPIVLYIPTPQRVFGRRVVMTAARSTSVPHSGVAAGEDALLVSVCVCPYAAPTTDVRGVTALHDPHLTSMRRRYARPGGDRFARANWGCCYCCPCCSLFVRV